ncbi:MAG: PEP-CTERM sorting domain-containing protein [Tepidisphaeraceae bacterium]
MKHRLAAHIALWVSFCAATTSFAAIGASGDTSMPSTTTDHFFGGGGFNINETVFLDPTAGPWIKNLHNGGSGHASGQQVQIVELLTNTGNEPWTDWHERVVTRTTISSPNDAPGFLFNSNSLSLDADYGAGFVPLTEGVDYTVSPTFYSGPGGDPGNSNHWEAIDLFFAPGREILLGDTLQIQKTIFEVFLDGNIWQPGEIATIAEYPTPEPSSAAVVGMSLLAFAARRRR